MGGSGGGASSGSTIPDYLQEAHEHLLNHRKNDTPIISIVDALNSAVGASPYSGSIVYNPVNELTQISLAVETAQGLVNDLDHVNDYIDALNFTSAEIDGVLDPSVLTLDTPTIDISTVTIDAEIEAFRLVQLDNLENQILPEFKSGMLNINAIQTSSFVMGEALLRGFHERDVGKYAAELRNKLYVSSQEINTKFILQTQDSKIRYFSERNSMVVQNAIQMMQGLYKKRELWLSTLHMTIEAKKLHIIARKEEIEGQLDFDENDALWDINLFQPVANLLASVQGGVTPQQRKPNKAVSALAGAISGASMGVSIGAPIAGVGAGVGAVAGGIAGGLLGYFGS